MITFVTCFFHGANPKRTYDDYKRHFDSIVTTGIPIVLFLDTRSSWTFPTNVHVYRVSLEDTWVGQNIPTTRILPANRSQTDTFEYLAIMNTKTEWLYKASTENPFQTEWFTWIDFGLAHVFKNPIETLLRLKHLQPPCHPCLRTAGIWGQWGVSPDSVHWRFAGGFLLAHISKIPNLHNLVKSKLTSIQPAMTWEVNVWAMVENDGFEFGWFSSDHNDTIIPLQAQI